MGSRNFDGLSLPLEEVARPGVPEEERRPKSEVGNRRSEGAASESLIQFQRSKDRAHLSGRGFFFRRPLAQQADEKIKTETKTKNNKKRCGQ
ncbi:MAG: hypothetical protein DA408_11775 [Bacteroidetes bacterium]|nr:MAG: hypothetical protein C7N36_20260 [Bacteroidota bacterium]PTM12126.1 MAG: hypothetical protein DA408_11775 [Bacteroidota bacterium]